MLPERIRLIDVAVNGAHSGRRVCGVSAPRAVIARIAHGMAQTLALCRNDHRIPTKLHDQMRHAWEPGLVLAQEVARSA